MKILEIGLGNVILIYIAKTRRVNFSSLSFFFLSKITSLKEPKVRSGVKDRITIEGNPEWKGAQT